MKQLTSELVRIKAFFICFVMRSFWRGISSSHKFFVKETPKYIAGHRDIKWKTKETYIPTRGSLYYWYYPLTFKEKLRYPFAYCRFMRMCISDIVRGQNYA